ncbi:hypothetical protein [Limnohabitans sp. 2KL-17]|uniref:hypothetical protein n=1 Tax=Limnohabitans sp. 2KL-17 TaxID=1100704 RepID=UPI0011B22B8A|nr:hypothetical protein [Limnohabitans sp. 2KL-17]
MATKTKSKPSSATFARTPKVPNFSEAAIYIADLCAREAWLGKSYETGKKKSQHLDIEITDEYGVITKESFSTYLSDENFLTIFATHLLRNAGVSGVKTYKGGDTITYNNFGALLDAAQLNSAVNTNKTSVDIPNGLNFLKNDLVVLYKKWNKDNYKNPNPELAKQMVKKLSEELCVKVNGVSTGNQPAIASRLLNFGFPDLCVYNYSTGIHRGLRLSNSYNSVLIDKYYELLDEGYERNWHVLSKYEMPISSKVNDVVWQRARNGGWWQRRIYDLALKMYFTDDDGKNYFSSFSPYVQEHIFIKPRAFD